MLMLRQETGCSSVESLNSAYTEMSYFFSVYLVPFTLSEHLNAQQSHKRLPVSHKTANVFFDYY